MPDFRRRNDGNARQTYSIGYLLRSRMEANVESPGLANPDLLCFCWGDSGGASQGLAKVRTSPSSVGTMEREDKHEIDNLHLGDGRTSNRGSRD
jgi:hypothetical protein